MIGSALILIVEDNLANQVLASAVLERGGFRVEIVSTASEARNLLDTQTPDLILMDIQLPGESGLEFTRRLRADPGTAAIPIVAVTAHAMAGDREEMLSAGCDGYIAKPIDTRRFAEQVGQFLPDRRQQEAV